MNHYFTNNDNIKSEIHSFKTNIRDNNYIFYTDNGVFSKRGIDFGTRLLLETLPVNEIKGSVLDVGCGYGSIGIIVKKETSCEMDMIDINARALHLSKMNAKANNADVNIFESDLYSNVIKKYDFIITNPPIRIGKEKVYEILIKGQDFLKPNGQLWFVMRKDQGVKSTLNELQKIYNVSIIDKKSGFFIICATKKSKSVDIA